MAKDRAGRPRPSRFTRSGHTSHSPRGSEYSPGTAPPPPSRTAPQPPLGRARDHPQAGYRHDPGQDFYRHDPGQSGYRHDRGQEFTAPVYHGAQPPRARSRPAIALGKAAFFRTNQAARLLTRKVINASKADGAQESGLTALIWNQVLSYGADAMITVALAGTVFFGASAHAQRGNVLLYLLITMAPFAVVAPVIGPALDRLQHGRRWAMAATAIGRAVLALIMASHPTELLVLYPCALGSLVLSKAYAVIRAAAAPRLVPPGMTLTEANARLSIFGLASTLVLGGVVGAVIKVTGSYSAGLWLTAIAYAVCAVLAVRLPSQVDSTPEPHRHRHEPPPPRRQERAPVLARLRAWAGRGFEPHVVVALQGESALRLLSGLLTIYLAFYVEGTAHGFDAAADLAAVVAAAGAGNFTGTALGTRLKIAKPEYVIVLSVAIVAAVCVLVALSFGIVFAVLGMFVGAVANALCKIALDALIQRDVSERLRSSAFARSETFLQLAWVLGAAIGVVLPSDATDGGAIGFWVAALVLGGVAVVTALRLRVLRRLEADRAQSATQRIRPDRVDMRKTRPY